MAILDSLKALFSGGRVDIAKRFSLLRAATQGTMSSFYMARDRSNDRVVGLKVLDPKKTAAVEARFKDAKKPSEGEVAKGLRSPRIVETYEFGQTTDDRQYIVMEFLGGPDFNSMVVGRNPLLDGRRVEFIRQAAEALQAVHEAGFIYRDMCPRNLMLCDGQDNLKLIDFGLTIPARPPFTLPGNRTGTPNYMAPELVRRRPTDLRTDIFSLGVTAYELCSFELPWPSGTTGMAAMTHDRAPMDLRTRRPKINPKLAQAIHWCIEPDVDKRCPTVRHLLDAIRELKHEDQA